MNDKHRVLITLLMLFDLAVVTAAFSISTVLIVREQHSDMLIAQFLSMRITLFNFLLIISMLLICHIVLRTCGLYRSMRLSPPRQVTFVLIWANTLSAICLAVFSLIFSIKMMHWRFLADFWAFSIVFLCISRLFVRLTAKYLRLHGRNLRYLLVVGTNPQAVEFARKVIANKELGYRLIGFVGDEWSGSSELTALGFQMVCSYSDLSEYIRHTVIDEVAIHLQFEDFQRNFFEVANLCQQHGILVRFNADAFRLASSRWCVEILDGDHFIAAYTGFSGAWQQIIKRLLDIAVSGLLLLAFLPIFLAATIAIKMTSRGSIFFLQERIGLNKRRFKMYKFRTMVPNAEALIATLEQHNEMAGPVFKMKSDPRITPIGRFLRRTSIDELPQLLNVLKGDMSLVGPRPLPVRDYQGFNEDWQRRRFSIKPGITCLWQITGRNNITFHQWMKLDLQYVDEWSLWLDVKILAKTLPAVLKGSGAA